MALFGYTGKKRLIPVSSISVWALRLFLACVEGVSRKLEEQQWEIVEQTQAGERHK
jgi:hypothetical protein